MAKGLAHHYADAKGTCRYITVVQNSLRDVIENINKDQNKDVYQFKLL